MIEILLGFLGKIIAEVFINVLSTPAVEIEVSTVEGPLETISTPADDLVNRYNRMLNRG